MRFSTTLLLIAMVLIVALAAACGDDDSPTPTAPIPTPTTSQPSEGYILEIYVKNEKVGQLNLAELQGMPHVSIDDAGIERGPTLLSVLDRMEVQDFTQVVATGLSRGRKASATLTLGRRDVNEEVILGLTARSTAKLAGVGIDRADWIIDVTRLDVEGNVGFGRSDYSIEVRSGGSVIATLDISDLRALETQSFSQLQGQEGPTLLSVLTAAGVSDFESVRVTGLSIGRQGPAEMTLTKDQLNDQVILDFTRQDTVKLAGPDIDREQWILDVTRLDVD